MDTPNTHILSWLCRSTFVTSIKSSRVNIVLCTSNLNEIFASVFHTWIACQPAHDAIQPQGKCSLTHSLTHSLTPKKKILWSHFWIDFNRFYTKTFRIVHILIAYLLIMLLWVIFICTQFKHNKYKLTYSFVITEK